MTVGVPEHEVLRTLKKQIADALSDAIVKNWDACCTVAVEHDIASSSKIVGVKLRVVRNP